MRHPYLPYYLFSLSFGVVLGIPILAFTLASPRVKARSIIAQTGSRDGVSLECRLKVPGSRVASGRNRSENMIAINEVVIAGARSASPHRRHSPLFEA